MGGDQGARVRVEGWQREFCQRGEGFGESKEVSGMQMKNKGGIMGLGILFLVLSVAAGEPRYGGTLRYAMIGDPPHLDQHVVTSDLVDTVAQHIFETLFAFDANWEPKPLLLQSYEVSEDGKQWVLYLRHGVLFHNGKEMTAEDVVASIKRWCQYGVRGPTLNAILERMTTQGDYTVVLELKRPYGVLPALLALHTVIYPKEIAEAATAKPIPPEQYVGTGPYKFVEWQPGKFIRLVRFDGYVSPSGEPNGYVGRRTPYLDELLFIPVPEPGTRLAGVLTGDYDFAENIPTDLYGQAKNAPDVVCYRVVPPTAAGIYFNTAEGLMSNQLLRQAVLAALDMEPMLEVAYAPGFWQAEGSLLPQGTIWYTKAGTEFYDQADPERARVLAKQAGYAGEPIRIICTSEYRDHYQRALILRDQLQKGGFNVDLQVYDWATLVSRRANPKLWDIFISNHCFYPDPDLYTIMDPNYPTHWNTPEKEALRVAFQSATSFEERYAIWEKLQALMYEQVPYIKVGDCWALSVARAAVKGFDESVHPIIVRPYFWNIWIER
jgi:peptide/nickel transport system substrate-binding protein